MKIKVSIIVPIYNTNVKYLDECVTSIIKQSYKDLEIILLKKDQELMKFMVQQKFQKDTDIDMRSILII